MDINATLKELKELSFSIQVDIENGKIMDIADDVARMAELFEALDGWLSKGGFLPQRWNR